MMLNRFWLLMLLSVFISCTNFGSPEAPASEVELTQITLKTDLYNFGEIENNESVGYRFAFVNDGEHPLIIQKVEVGCGCIAVDYSKKPVQPSDKGFVEVVLDPRGQNGMLSKKVNVYANVPDGIFYLTIIGQVK